MLTDPELDGMRATMRESLPNLADITRASSPVADGSGGRTTTPARIVASVPVRVAPASGLEGRADTLVGDAMRNTQRWQLTFPQGTNVAPADTVTVGARAFTVLSVADPRSFGLSCRVNAVEVLE